MDKLSQSEKLKSIIEYFEMHNKSIATALGVHPALVSRWKNEKLWREVNHRSMENNQQALVVLDHGIRWLKENI